MDIVSRAEWGAKPWEGSPYSVAITEREHFLTHYHGNPPASSVGFAVPRDVERIHLAKGWAGVGYNFLVDQKGVPYEGRGWGLVGAHCPGYNRNGIGVYVAVGGTQKPTDAALRTVRDLYDEACRRSGRKLSKMGHRDGIATACPGSRLYAWVKDGMPRPGGSTAAPAPAKPVVDLSRLIAAAKADPPKAGTPVSYYGVKTVESALVAERLLDRSFADGHFGTATVKAYAALQRRYGYSGSDADGIPGKTSLTRLGKAHGFTVKD